MTAVDTLNAHQITLRRLETEQARLRGQRDQLEKDMKEKFGVDTIDDAEALYKQKKAEVDSLDVQVATLLAEIETDIALAQGSS